MVVFQGSVSPGNPGSIIDRILRQRCDNPSPYTMPYLGYQQIFPSNATKGDVIAILHLGETYYVRIVNDGNTRYTIIAPIGHTGLLSGKAEITIMCSDSMGVRVLCRGECRPKLCFDFHTAAMISVYRKTNR